MRRRRLLKLKVGSEIISGKSNCKKSIRQPNITLPICSFKQSHPSLIPTLESIPSDEEIWEAIKSCDPDKALGYDGFNLRFLIKMWDIVGFEILAFVKSLFIQGQLLTQINTTQVTLVPKVDCPKAIEEFRPVKMVGCLYKIIIRRLKNVMSPLISEN